MSRPLDLSTLYSDCANLVADAIAGIDAESLAWQPGPESRSIREITRHLIRVDIWFLSQFELSVPIADPGEASPVELLTALRQFAREVTGVVDASSGALGHRAIDPEKLDRSLGEVVMHMCHHYLYHFSQILYLRRVRDRDWKSPMKDWERLTYQLGEDSIALNAN